MRLRPQSFEEFISPNRVAGHQSRVRGKLWHLFVRNYQPLQEDFRANARNQLQELNEPQLAASFLPINPTAKVPDLVDGKGEAIKVAGKFGRPRKAHAIQIIKSDGRAVEFVDDMYVSYAGYGAERSLELLERSRSQNFRRSERLPQADWPVTVSRRRARS